MRMEHESPDLDGVIDEIAQAMTSAELTRDLRPAIAARVASRTSWTIGWRVATATAALAVIVVTMIVVSRPGEEPRQTPSVAEAVTPPPVVEGGEPGDAPAVARVEAIEPRKARPVARIARQTIAPAGPGIVEIDPVAIVPLKEDDAASAAQGSSPRVDVLPLKDVEPVRISQLVFGE